MEDLYGRKKAYVNTGLIALNVLYFLFLEATGSSENTSFMVVHGAMYAPLVIEKGEYYRLITSVFMHFGISHIMNNMLILFTLAGGIGEDRAAEGAGGQIHAGESGLVEAGAHQAAVRQLQTGELTLGE